MLDRLKRKKTDEGKRGHSGPQDELGVHNAIGLPTVDECECHLRLLKIFSDLRDEVCEDDSMFEELPDLRLARERASSHEDGELNLVKEKRWKLYVQRAASRFEAWWRSHAATDEDGRLKPITRMALLEPDGLEDMVKNAEAIKWTTDSLLPLDQLLVLHSFMLNPRCFLEDCIRYGMIWLWKTGLPSIDSYSDHEEFIDISMIRPEHMHGIYDKLSVDDVPSDTGRGEVEKLRIYIDRLRKDDGVLPGTILGYDGLAVSSGPRHDDHPELEGTSYLNTFLRSSRQANSLLCQLNHDEVDLAQWYSDLDAATRMNKYGKAGVQRFIRSMRGNSSLFSLDLASAVVRQGLFIDKMQDLAWLWSPGLPLTLTKITHNYPIFLEIIAQNPSQISVPTIAVDLAWHTHQLSPDRYYHDTVAMTDGRVFIDHDDRLEEGTLGQAFTVTTKEFEKLSGGRDYGECLCWKCMVQQALDQTRTPFYRRLRFRSRAGSPAMPQLICEAQFAKLEDDFVRTCLVAERQGRSAPDQAAFLAAYKWRHPELAPRVHIRELAAVAAATASKSE